MSARTLSALLAAAALCLTGAASAQSADAVSPAKKELIARILKAQHGGIEALGRALALQPAQQIQLGAQNAMLRIAPEKREALGKEIDADLRKYTDEAVPLVRDKAVALAPAIFNPVLEKNFTEDELKHILAALESPIILKYQQQVGQMQQALSAKLVAEVRGTMETKIKALDQSVGNRLSKAAAAGAPAK